MSRSSEEWAKEYTAARKAETECDALRAQLEDRNSDEDEKSYEEDKRIREAAMRIAVNFGRDRYLDTSETLKFAHEIAEFIRSGVSF